MNKTTNPTHIVDVTRRMTTAQKQTAAEVTIHHARRRAARALVPRGSDARGSDAHGIEYSIEPAAIEPKATEPMKPVKTAEEILALRHLRIDKMKATCAAKKALANAQSEREEEERATKNADLVQLCGPKFSDDYSKRPGVGYAQKIRSSIF